MAKQDWARGLWVVVSLGLIGQVLRAWDVEKLRGLEALVWPVLGAGLLSWVLPRAVRAPWFVAVSVWSLGTVSGWPAAAAVLGYGGVLIALCHVPAPHALRVALVVLAGGALAAARALDGVELPFASTQVIVTLASMFMLRIIVYLYDLRHGQEPKGLWLKLGYFFMLPNVCFPFFPVVDSRTWERTFLSAGALDALELATRRIGRGLVQVLIYRVVYLHWMPGPEEVEDFPTLLLFVFGSYALYLHISGQFHIIVGLLGLFGFQLPETHNRFFLASSFADLWRRINIYWTDFMAKVVYFPLHARLKRHGMNLAFVLATAGAFLTTWFLHGYVWFWLRGSSAFPLVDAFFFGILGLLVIANVQLEGLFGRARRYRKGTWPLGAAIKHAFKVVGVFCTVALLWSLWSHDTPATFWAMCVAGNGTPVEWLQLIAAASGVAVAGGVVRWALDRASTMERPRLSQGWQMATLAAPGLLLALSSVQGQVALGTELGTLVRTVTTDSLSERDQNLVVRGYYEGLLQASKVNSRVWEAGYRKPKDWVKWIASEGADTDEGRIPRVLVKPNMSFVYKRVLLTTNSFGMRGEETTKDKPPGTYRIGIFGSSYAFGSGVGDDETMGEVLERTLQGSPALAGHERLEVLNFAVPEARLFETLVLFNDRAPDFDLDLSLFITPAAEPFPKRFGLLARTRPELARAVLDPLGIELSEIRGRVRKVLVPRRTEVLTSTFAAMRRISVEAGAPMAYVPIPYMNVKAADGAERKARRKAKAKAKREGKRKGKRKRKSRREDERKGRGGVVHDAELLAAVEASGMPVIDLRGCYGDRDTTTLQAAPWDTHPNAEAHRIMGRALARELAQHIQGARRAEAAAP